MTTPGARSTTAGSASAVPPREVQEPHPEEENARWFGVPLASRATTSIRPTPHEEADGADVSVPPSPPQPDHAPLYAMCQRLLSPPRTKTSMRFPPHEVADGAAARNP